MTDLPFNNYFLLREGLVQTKRNHFNTRVSYGQQIMAVTQFEGLMSQQVNGNHSMPLCLCGCPIGKNRHVKLASLGSHKQDRNTGGGWSCFSMDQMAGSRSKCILGSFKVHTISSSFYLYLKPILQMASRPAFKLPWFLLSILAFSRGNQWMITQGDGMHGKVAIFPLMQYDSKQDLSWSVIQKKKILEPDVVPQTSDHCHRQIVPG